MATHLLSCPPHPVCNQHRATGLIRTDKQWGFLALKPRSSLIHNDQNYLSLPCRHCLAFRKKLPTVFSFYYLFSQFISSKCQLANQLINWGKKLNYSDTQPESDVLSVDSRISQSWPVHMVGGGEEWARKSHAGKGYCASLPPVGTYCILAFALLASCPGLLHRPPPEPHRTELYLFRGHLVDLLLFRLLNKVTLQQWIKTWRLLAGQDVGALGWALTVVG